MISLRQLESAFGFLMVSLAREYCKLFASFFCAVGWYCVKKEVYYLVGFPVSKRMPVRHAKSVLSSSHLTEKK